MAGLADNFLFNPLLRQPLLGAEDSYDKLFASITVTPSKFDISSIAVAVVLRLVKSKAHHSPQSHCPMSNSSGDQNSLLRGACSGPNQQYHTAIPRERDPHRRGSLVGKRI
jgi:hypothetical protein